jgi:hypothetical protein
MFLYIIILCLFISMQIIYGPSWQWSYGSWIYYYLCNHYLSQLMLWVQISIRARCTTLCDKVCQWLVAGWWFSLGPLVSSTNKADRHDITELLLKVALKHHQTNKQIYIFYQLPMLSEDLRWEMTEKRPRVLKNILFILSLFCIHNQIARSKENTAK